MRIVAHGTPLDRRTLKERDAALLAAIDRQIGGLRGLRARFDVPVRLTSRVND